MAEQELSLLIRLKDEASAQLKQLNREIETNTKSWKENFGAIKAQAQTAGIAMAAFGAAVTGAFLYAYKASEESRIKTVELTNTLKNLGVSYSSVKGEIEAFTRATEKSTGVAKDEQIQGLNQLLQITGDYDMSMKALPIALDLAAAKNMDVTQAAILLGRVIEGDINALNRYGFSMDGVTSAAEALRVAEDKLKGSAAAKKGPFDDLINSWKDFVEIVGALVSGPIKDLLAILVDIIEKVTAWAEANPEAASSLFLLVLAIAAALAVMGPVVVALIGFAAALYFLGNPVMWVIGLITLLIAYGLWMATQWDRVRSEWTGIWAAFKDGLVLAIAPIRYLIGLLIQSAFDIVAAWEPTRSFWENLWMAVRMIFRNAVNDVIYLMNLIPKALNSLMDILGVKHTFQLIPELTMGMLGYTGEVNRGGISGEQWDAFTGGSAGGAGGVGGVMAPPYTEFGNFGNLGRTFAFPGGISITINNAGSVISEQDLGEQIRQILIDIQNRNTVTGIR